MLCGWHPPVLFISAGKGQLGATLQKVPQNSDLHKVGITLSGREGKVVKREAEREKKKKLCRPQPVLISCS